MAQTGRTRRVYVDSSVWIALLAHEPSAADLLTWLQAEQGQLMTAMWTRTELASALSVKVRRGELNAAKFTELLKCFDEWIVSDVQLLPVDNADFQRAANLCADSGSRLRAGDALHLTVAQRCQASHMASLDRDLLGNALKSGLQDPLVYETSKSSR